jgi:FixJ family two-component response regulator
MLDAVQLALERDRARRANEQGNSDLKERLTTLTERELQVMILVISGMMNKQVAAQMGITEITVKVHRGNVMRKMGARSLPELVRMADQLGVRQPSR